MQRLRPTFDLDAFFARLRTAPRRVLMLDYDGTLAPFQTDPAAAVPYAQVPALLDAIMASGRTRVVIVSGRWIKGLVPLLGLKALPEIWGSHGWERLQPDGAYATARIKAPALEVLISADDWSAGIERLGARREHKPAAVAFHWRGLPNDRVADIRSKIFEKWMELAATAELGWHDFDGGIELRARGWDKGEVVRTLLAESGPGAVCAYLGDDLGDEAAFKVMPPDGLSGLVRPQFRPTAANLWIRPPEELCEFLARWT